MQKPSPVGTQRPRWGSATWGLRAYTVDVFAFEAGDTLLLFTDGVIEARDRGGDFYPLAERAAQWTESPRRHSCTT